MTERKVPDGFKHYEDGKHRRYGLLFTVNAGAFTIAKVFVEKASEAGKDISSVADKDISSLFLGGLTLKHIALGMIAFTALMVVDIFSFGWGMRQNYVHDRFGLAGMFVLGAIGFVIAAGWYLVAYGPVVTLGGIFVLSAIGLLTGFGCYLVAFGPPWAVKPGKQPRSE